MNTKFEHPSRQNNFGARSEQFPYVVRFHPILSLKDFYCLQLVVPEPFHEMALEQLIEGNKNLSMTELDESGPHREIALIVRQNYSGERDAQILCSILKTELDIRFSKQ